MALLSLLDLLTSVLVVVGKGVAVVCEGGKGAAGGKKQPSSKCTILPVRKRHTGRREAWLYICIVLGI